MRKATCGDMKLIRGACSCAGTSSFVAIVWGDG